MALPNQDEFLIDLVDNSDPSQSSFKTNSMMQTHDPIKFFQLSTNPFADSVNPEFFFRTDTHEDAFIQLKRSIEDDISLGLLTAPSGTGKTLLSQILLNELDSQQYETIILLAYPKMTRNAILREVVKELKVEDIPARPTTHELFTCIENRIIELFSERKKLVMFIDEVHFLSADSLHLLRTFSNIEIPRKKLVTVLLFGEDSFLMKQKFKTYKSIFSRMFIRCKLRSLDEYEVEQYIKFRLLIAGGKTNIFMQDTFSRIFKMTGGIPRDINRICHNALLRAARYGKQQISSDLIY